MATIDDFVYLTDVDDDDLTYHNEHGERMKKRIIEPLQKLGFIFKKVVFHATDDRVPFVGIMVKLRPDDKTAHVFLCEKQEGLVIVGSIHPSLNKVTLAQIQPGRHLNPPKEYFENFEQLETIMEESGTETRYVPGQWS